MMEVITKEDLIDKSQPQIASRLRDRCRPDIRSRTAPYNKRRVRSAMKYASSNSIDQKEGQTSELDRVCMKLD